MQSESRMPFNRMRQYLGSTVDVHRQFQIDGCRLGHEWASRLATLDDLWCLEIFITRLRSTGQLLSWFVVDPRDPFTLAERWHFAVIDPIGANVRNRVPFDPNRSQAARFWKCAGVAAEQQHSGVFLFEFSVSALKVWSKFSTGRRGDQ